MAPTDLSGRTILITGASTGIGRAIGRELASRGARIVSVARDRSRLEGAVAALPGDGHSARPMDVTDASAWPGLITEAAQGGELHGLVTAAAVVEPIGPTAEVDPGDVLEALRINLWGTFLAIHHAMPALVAAGDGAVVTLSGGGATGPFPRYDAYAMSKAGVVRLTENVARDEARVRANSVAPGFVATPMHEATLRAGEELAGANAGRTREQLKGGGVPAETAAELTALLLSPAAAEVTGKLISAEWDPWRDVAFLERLAAEPDLCSVRRIDDQFFGPLDPGG